MFTENTFKYFDDARENKFSPNWFKENEINYQMNVKGPFIQLLTELSIFCKDDLLFNPTKISRPTRPKNRHIDKGISKDFSSIIINKLEKSRFNLPPCVHIQLGSLDEDNFIKVGMYITNSSQIKKYRQHIDLNTHHLIENISKDCGELQGEKYKKCPSHKESIKELQYLYWFKSFYFCRYFSRKEVTSKNFSQNIIQFTQNALPFYHFLNSIM